MKVEIHLENMVKTQFQKSSQNEMLRKKIKLQY